MDKQTLRKEMKAKRLALSVAELAIAAQEFCVQLQSYFTQTVAKAGRQFKIGIYLASKGELDLTPSINWLWQQGHSLYAPVIAAEILSFHEWQPDTKTKLNQFGLTEPTQSPMIAAEALDYVLVPLVAFNRQGQRLGMGKGYYDQTFAFRRHSTTPILIGCAYAFQEVAELPTEAHDIPLNFILKSSFS